MSFEGSCITDSQDGVHLYASYMKFVYRCMCCCFDVIGVWSFSKFLEMVELFVQEENYGDCNGLRYAGGKEGYTYL